MARALCLFPMPVSDNSAVVKNDDIQRALASRSPVVGGLQRRADLGAVADLAVAGSMRHICTSCDVAAL